MAIEAGSAFVTLLPSAKGFGAAMKRELAGDLSGAGKTSGEKAGGGFKAGFKGALLGGGGLLAVAGLTNMFKGFIGDARESAKIGALTEQVIKTTGGAAGITAAQVGDLATAISKKTGVDDEAIQSASNLLLTFTSLKNGVGEGNDVFNQATALATDMSTALGTDAKGAALQLGKALNNPVKGVAALGRAGVSFTDQQKEQIKTLTESGDLLGAQKIILGEVGKEFGGAAAAAGTPMDKLKVSLGNVGETIGATLIPWLDRGATFLTTTFLPALAQVGGFLQNNQTTIKVVAGIIGAVLIPALIAWGVQSTIAAAKSAAAWVLTQLGAIRSAAAHAIAFAAMIAGWVGMALRAGVSAAFVVGAWVLMGVQSLLAAARMAAAWFIAMGPIGWAIAAIIAIVVLIVKNWDTIKAATAAAWAAISAWVSKGVAWVWARISTGFRLIRAVFMLYVNAWRLIITTAWNVIKAVVTGAVNAVKAVITGVFRAIRFVVLTYVNGWRLIITTAWNLITGAVSKAIDLVKSIIGRLGQIVGVIRGHFDAARRAATEALGGLIDFVTGLPGRILDSLGDLGGMLFDKGRDVIQGLINGIGSMVGNLASATADAVKSGISNLLPGSPVKKGPLRVLNNGRAGGQITSMIAEGITGNLRVLDVAAEAMAARASITAQAQLSASGVQSFTPGLSAGVAGGDGGATFIKVQIGERDLTDIVRIEQDRRDLAFADGLTYRGV